MTAKTDNLFRNGIFFFFALFLFSSTFSIALSQASFAVSLLLFVTFALISKYNPFPKKIWPVYIPILLYLFWMFISCLVNDAPLLNLKEEWLFLIIPVGIFLFKHKQYRMLLVHSLAGGVILVSVYGIIQHFFGVNWFKDYPLPSARDNTFYATGGFSNYLTYGNYLAPVSLFLFSLVILKLKSIRNISNWLIFYGGFIGIMGTIMSYSRTAIAALPFGILAMAWLKGRKWILTAAALVIVAVGLTFLLVPNMIYKYEMAFKQDLAGESESSRLFIWKKSVLIALDHPLFGVGQGNFEKEYVNYLDSFRNETRTRPHAHNDILNFAAVAGFPGAFFFVSIWIILFYKLHLVWHGSHPFSDKQVFAGAAAVAGLVFLVTSITEAAFADEEVRQILMALWAAGLWPLLAKNSDDTLETNESS